ncbi:MAG: FAD-dependent oxidoreductase, partial [Thermoplasmata archaeon]|nr:FAD-dependent oxidoreductase [Thermoplasmata archaeon]
MNTRRIENHPILEAPVRKEVTFNWNGAAVNGYEGEMLSSALISNGVDIFGHHPKDNSPQGIFCANGQCAQCLVICNGKPVKSCMTPLAVGMDVRSVEGLPEAPGEDAHVETHDIPVKDVDVLVIGGGPAGLSASLELGKLGVSTLMIDDKDRLGGKLVLQTHKFFGSVKDSFAGTRGYRIGDILADELKGHESVETWTETTAVGVFSDGLVGLMKGDQYHLIRPKKLLVTAGARERMLSFPGNTLPGVYGAGAFQTIVNRDMVRCSERIMIIGGGNVGLIAGYHAIQAGIEVVGLVEALPRVGGYKVHADKLMRLGVPIWTRHTVVAAHGEERVESVTIAQLDESWKVIKGTERRFEVDTVLIAVGLAEVDEFFHKAREFNIDVFSAGDSQEIAEASAAMFSGRIEGLRIAGSLGLDTGEIPREWNEKMEVLRSKPGLTRKIEAPEDEEGVMPIIHCDQEIPCNPCSSVCPKGSINMEGGTITGLPWFDEEKGCIGCLSCVGICPGLAITLVDYRDDPDMPTVTLPYEVWREEVEVGRVVPVLDENGGLLGRYMVEKVVSNPRFPGTLMVQV